LLIAPYLLQMYLDLLECNVDVECIPEKNLNALKTAEFRIRRLE
jgi:hypothetical protein